MPRNLRRTRFRKTRDPQEIKLLTHGVSLTTRFGIAIKLRDREGLRALWSELRDELLGEWVAEHPFTRPFAWLLFEATEPRLPVSGEAAAEAHEWTGAHNHFRQHCFLGINRLLGIEDDSRDSKAAFESEKQYVIRLGLLTDAELALL